MKVVVDRSRWLRGEGGARSYLQRADDGKRCCLGFACLQAGLPGADIVGQKTPRNLTATIGPWAITEKNGSLLMEAAIQVNDAKTRTMPCAINIDLIKVLCLHDAEGQIADEADREARLIRILNAAGLELEFVDGPVTTDSATV